MVVLVLAFPPSDLCYAEAIPELEVNRCTLKRFVGRPTGSEISGP